MPILETATPFAAAFFGKELHWNAREEMFRTYRAVEYLRKDIDTEDILRMTKGFTGTEIKRVMNLV